MTVAHTDRSHGQDLQVPGSSPGGRTHLEVFGIPQPQGNKTGFYNKKTGKVVLVEGRRAKARAAFGDWRGAVAQAARDWQEEHNAPLLNVPVRVHIEFRMPRPKSAPKKRLWPDTRPDLDKLTRSVLDALTGLLISDDSRVCELVVRKTFAADTPPGCTITVEVL